MEDVVDDLAVNHVDNNVIDYKNLINFLNDHLTKAVRAGSVFVDTAMFLDPNKLNSLACGSLQPDGTTLPTSKDLGLQIFYGTLLVYLASTLSTSGIQKILKKYSQISLSSEKIKLIEAALIEALQKFVYISNDPLLFTTDPTYSAFVKTFAAVCAAPPILHLIATLLINPEHKRDIEKDYSNLYSPVVAKLLTLEAMFSNIVSWAMFKNLIITLVINNTYDAVNEINMSQEQINEYQLYFLILSSLLGAASIINHQSFSISKGLLTSMNMFYSLGSFFTSVAACINSSLLEIPANFKKSGWPIVYINFAWGFAASIWSGIRAYLKSADQEPSAINNESGKINSTDIENNIDEIDKNETGFFSDSDTPELIEGPINESTPLLPRAEQFPESRSWGKSIYNGFKSANNYISSFSLFSKIATNMPIPQRHNPLMGLNIN